MPVCFILNITRSFTKCMHFGLVLKFVSYYKHINIKITFHLAPVCHANKTNMIFKTMVRHAYLFII